MLAIKHPLHDLREYIRIYDIYICVLYLVHVNKYYLPVSYEYTSKYVEIYHKYVSIYVFR